MRCVIIYFANLISMATTDTDACIAAKDGRHLQQDCICWACHCGCGRHCQDSAVQRCVTSLNIIIASISIPMAVDAGHRAVIFDLLHDGVLPDVKGEGTHFIVPVIQACTTTPLVRACLTPLPAAANLLRRALQAAQHCRHHGVQGCAPCM